MDPTATDQTVRLRLFERIVADEAMPDAAHIAADLGIDERAVRDALQRLHTGRAIVLEPGRDDRVRMANPFSAVETPFRVKVGDKQYFGNCIWDALGIPAALGADAELHCSCGDCGEAMSVTVRAGEVTGEGMIHFGVPALHWWDDIIFT